jgi:hypothetical protein
MPIAKASSDAGKSARSNRNEVYEEVVFSGQSCFGFGVRFNSRELFNDQNAGHQF